MLRELSHKMALLVLSACGSEASKALSSSAKPRKLPPGNWRSEVGRGHGHLRGAPFSLRARLLFRESDCRETKDDSRALGEILDLKKMIRNPTPSRIWHSEFAKSFKKKKIGCIRSWLQHSGSLLLTWDLSLWYTGFSLVAACGLSSCRTWA